MWQRIQTLYLAIATGLIAALFFLPMAASIGTEGQTASIAYTDFVPFLVLLVVSGALNLLALLLFRRRTLQMRLVVIAALILLGFQAWLAVRYFTAADGIVHKATVLFPLVAAILDLLALKGIVSDEMMVQSFSHLRTRKKNRR